MHTYIDRRGNRTVAADLTQPPTVVHAAVVPDRENEAELAGQQTVEVYRVIVGPEATEVTTWAQIRWHGDMYDVHSPPVLHQGTRRTKHWTAYIRKRPAVGPGPGILPGGEDG